MIKTICNFFSGIMTFEIVLQPKKVRRAALLIKKFTFKTLQRTVFYKVVYKYPLAKPCITFIQVVIAI